MARQTIVDGQCPLGDEVVRLLPGDVWETTWGALDRGPEAVFIYRTPHGTLYARPAGGGDYSTPISVGHLTYVRLLYRADPKLVAAHVDACIERADGSKI